MLRTLTLILSASLISPVVNGIELTIFTEDEPSFPWIMKEEDSGLDFILLKMVDEKIDAVTFNYKRVPWKRCLQSMNTPEYLNSSGCFSASYKAKRKEFGVYPGGKNVDTNLRMHTSSYSAYVLSSNNKIKVTGKLSISGLSVADTVASPSGYSISSDLKENGYNVDDGAKESLANLKKLVLKRVEVVTVLTESGDFHISSNKYLKGKIKKLSPPIVRKPYYLMLSKGFVKKHSSLANEIWETIAEVRTSKEYKKQSLLWMKNNSYK